VELIGPIVAAASATTPIFVNQSYVYLGIGGGIVKDEGAIENPQLFLNLAP
jgi:hypothetical protein